MAATALAGRRRRCSRSAKPTGRPSTCAVASAIGSSENSGAGPSLGRPKWASRMTLAPLPDEFGDGRRDALDAGGVGDLAVGDRHVEVDAHQHALAADVADVVERLEGGHAGPFRWKIAGTIPRSDDDARLEPRWDEILTRSEIAQAVDVRLGVASVAGCGAGSCPPSRCHCVSVGLRQLRMKAREAVADLAGAQEHRHARHRRGRLEGQAEAGDPALVVDVAHDQLDRAERHAVGIFGVAAEPRRDQRADGQLAARPRSGPARRRLPVRRRSAPDRRRRRRRNPHLPDRLPRGWQTACRAGADSGPARRCRRGRRRRAGPCPGSASSGRRARTSEGRAQRGMRSPRATGLPGATR